MAQIWLTYAELSEMLSCGSEESRDRVRVMGCDRRRCHDGVTRVKLPEPMAEAYMLAFASARACAAKPSLVAALQNAVSDAFDRSREEVKGANAGDETDGLRSRRSA